MRKISVITVLIGLIIILVVIGFYWLVKSGQINWQVFGSQQPVMDYQAVFLTNGQVYFGKLKKITAEFVELDDIYYLQVQQPIQPKPEEKVGQKPDDQQPKLTLVKLGNEIHGPIDVMHINRDQVLFWEDLKDSGQVAQAIKKDKEVKK